MKDKDYLDHVAMQPCLICGHRSNIHHIIHGPDKGRVGRTDALIVPLCQLHHQDQVYGIHGTLKGKPDEFNQRQGPNQLFKNMYGIDLYETALRLREEYGTANI